MRPPGTAGVSPAVKSMGPKAGSRLVRHGSLRRHRAGDRDRPLAPPVLSARIRALNSWGPAPAGPTFSEFCSLGGTCCGWDDQQRVAPEVEKAVLDADGGDRWDPSGWPPAARRRREPAACPRRFVDGPRRDAVAPRRLGNRPRTLVDGSRKFVDGLGLFVDSPRRFVDGPRRFVDGLGLFVDGPRRFVDGLGLFVDGSRTFVDGLGLFVDGSRRFVDGPRRFVDGPRRFVDGYTVELAVTIVE